MVLISLAYLLAKVWFITIPVLIVLAVLYARWRSARYRRREEQRAARVAAAQQARIRHQEQIDRLDREREARRAARRNAR